MQDSRIRRAPASLPFVAALGLICALPLAGPGCGSDSSSKTTSGQTDPDDPYEITPEQMARELGVTNRSGPRTIAAKDFGKYPLVVDVFRRSAAHPVVGAFKPAYIPLLADASLPADQREALARKKFADLAQREFAIVSLNGRVLKAQVISGAIEGYAEGGYRSTPPGNYKLDLISYVKNVPQSDGTTRKMPVYFPWLRSSTFHNSEMYWGLWIFGGYFFHSTTHYGQLGQPASMGCVRQTFPDAMELFKLRQGYPGMIRIHAIGSQEAIDRFHAIATPEWTLPKLDQAMARIRAYIAYHGSNEVHLLGHAWVDPATGKPGSVDWPRCGPTDCFKIWGREPPSPFAEARDLDERNATEFTGSFIAL